MSVYHDLPTCDLRFLTDPEAIRQIERIHDVATLILPSDAPKDVMSAFSAIPKDDIASILYFPAQAKLNMINGCSDLAFTPEPNQYFIVNGMALIREMPETASATLYVNGLCLINRRLKDHPGLHLAEVNGAVTYCDLKEEPKLFSNKFTLDADTLRYLKKGQAIVVGNQLTIEQDVTVEMLLEKELTIIVGNKLLAPQHLLGYLKATATVMNQICKY